MLDESLYAQCKADKARKWWCLTHDTYMKDCDRFRPIVEALIDMDKRIGPPHKVRK